MKKLLLLLFLLPVMAFGQMKTKTRVFNGYTVEYTYNDTVYNYAWERQKRKIYFDATIQIYKDGLPVGQPYKGVYSPDPSLKDDPEKWIIKAKEL